MEPKDVIGLEAFERWEKDLARIKARKLVGQAGFTASDVADIEAELRIHIWTRRIKYNPGHAPHVTYETFMTRVVENKIRNILEARQSQKRYLTEGILSIDAPIEQKDGTLELLEEIISERQGLFPSIDDSPSRKTELKMAMAKAYEKLSGIQRDLYQLLLEGFSVRAAARTLGRPKITLDREFARMREIFRQEGLADYL